MSRKKEIIRQLRNHIGFLMRENTRLELEKAQRSIAQRSWPKTIIGIGLESGQMFATCETLTAGQREELLYLHMNKEKVFITSVEITQ